MNEEMRESHKNKTWEFVDLPPGRKVVGNKWVYKPKKNNHGLLEHYKACLVSEGYVLKFGIYFDEIFSHVVFTCPVTS